MDRDPPFQGTAIITGLTVMLCALFGLSREDTDRSPIQHRSPPETISVSFVGRPTDILVATETTEYAHCDPELRDGITRCATQAPGHAVTVTVVVLSKDRAICRSSNPLILRNHEILIGRFKGIELHEDHTYCEYEIMRTPSL